MAASSGRLQSAEAAPVILREGLARRAAIFLARVLPTIEAIQSFQFQRRSFV